MALKSVSCKLCCVTGSVCQMEYKHCSLLLQCRPAHPPRSILVLSPYFLFFILPVSLSSQLLLLLHTFPPSFSLSVSFHSVQQFDKACRANNIQVQSQVIRSKSISLRTHCFSTHLHYLPYTVSCTAKNYLLWDSSFATWIYLIQT